MLNNMYCNMYCNYSVCMWIDVKFLYKIDKIVGIGY